jgi:hypothetical protein
VITNEQLVIGEGLPAPVLRNHLFTKEVRIGNDTIDFLKREQIHD